MSKEKSEIESAKGMAEGQAGRLSQEVERLRRRVQELENEVAKLNRIVDEAKLQESRLEEKARRLEVRVAHKAAEIMGDWGRHEGKNHNNHVFRIHVSSIGTW